MLVRGGGSQAPASQSRCRQLRRRRDLLTAGKTQKSRSASDHSRQDPMVIYEAHRNWGLIVRPRGSIETGWTRLINHLHRSATTFHKDLSVSPRGLSLHPHQPRQRPSQWRTPAPMPRPSHRNSLLFSDLDQKCPRLLCMRKHTPQVRYIHNQEESHRWKFTWRGSRRYCQRHQEEYLQRLALHLHRLLQPLSRFPELITFSSMVDCITQCLKTSYWQENQWQSNKHNLPDRPLL